MSGCATRPEGGADTEGAAGATKGRRERSNMCARRGSIARCSTIEVAQALGRVPDVYLREVGATRSDRSSCGSDELRSAGAKPHGELTAMDAHRANLRHASHGSVTSWYDSSGVA